MGLVYADIELINGYDLEMARRHVIGEEEVKRIQVNALVDTGSVYLCINESIQEILQLPVMERLRSETADGRIEEFDMVQGVEVHFKGHKTTCRAMVLPGSAEPLFGAIPMEDMNLLVHPQRQELIDNPKLARI
ncbi:clan AA aspartic protease, AF_0612 family [Hydrobacter penzbergensis]|jgi:clan AA aspartic protease|uniref:Clan AA aspartic protease, AF_0612 family n=1 Tax=Hydrobacter penzbergensis TaxID=1235997 RepID=A0A8X8LD91_9BACT|nr:aspartyl protease family protein [Hydrobacter penzbergensis]SDW37989.1 clan AA aspartic protease, AF_0612 family [Hydrobacter penzbergensis]